MSDATILFLPSTTDAPYRWLRIEDDEIVDRGEGLPESGDPADPETLPLVAIAPADDVTLHWAALPDRSIAQAVAAARIAIAEASAAPLGDLHVAVGREDAADERPIGVVSLERMRTWLAVLASEGLDPDALVPAPMLLPRPEEGFVRAELAGQGVVRGAVSGFADDARLTELITGGEAPLTLDRNTVESALVAAASAPALDLRQGAFAKRRERSIDWALARRLAWLALAIFAVMLMVSLIQIMRTTIAADGIENRADMVARAGLPPGATVTDADRQLNERLASLRGGGLGFSRTAAAVFSAVQSVPGTELTALSFTEDGALKITVNAQGEAQANDLKSRIQSIGFHVDASTFQSAAGQLTGDLTVTP
jgi:general secretion pathway protein L